MRVQDPGWLQVCIRGAADVRWGYRVDCLE